MQHEDPLLMVPLTTGPPLCTPRRAVPIAPSRLQVSSGHCVQERRMLVETLQNVAHRRAARVTFLSGDVHAAALGQFYRHAASRLSHLHPSVCAQRVTATP